MDQRLNNPEWLRQEYPRRAAEDIARELGCCRNTVVNALRRHGIEVRPSGGASLTGKPKSAEHNRKNSLALQAYWAAHPMSTERRLKLSQSKRKDGTKKVGDLVYRWVYVPGVGSVAEHRHLMEGSAGRPLEPTEHVHHKDEDTLNNKRDNLAILTNAAHAAEHNKNRPRDWRQRFYRGEPPTMDPRLNDRDWLAAAYSQGTLATLATELGVSRDCVMHHMEQLGIPRRASTAHQEGRRYTPEQRAKKAAQCRDTNGRFTTPD